MHQIVSGSSIKPSQAANRKSQQIDRGEQRDERPAFTMDGKRHAAVLLLKNKRGGAEAAPS